MSFTNRIASAVAFEQVVVGDLENQGWLAGEFGQSLLPVGVRDQLRRHRTPVRWMPDIIAFRDDQALFIDAKNSLPHAVTGNHSVESASTDTQIKWADFSGIQVLYAFPHRDGRVGYITCAAWSVLSKPGPQHVNGGSGTPFHLCECLCVFHLDSVLGGAR